MVAIKDLTGNRVGRLVVMNDRKVIVKGNRRRVHWKCRCDCGVERYVNMDLLTAGRIKSCGCLRSELSRKRKYKHGMTDTRIHIIWQQMVARCETKSNTAYKHYGGMGVSVCDEWHDFVVFHQWAVQNGYNDSLTIDRIDVNGNYEPSNCRWVTKQEQHLNKRNTLYVTLNGERKPLKTWCSELGISYDKARRRLRHGWSAEKALA